MAVQVLPIIRAVAPYLAQVATAALPHFTSKPSGVAREDPVIARQIEELQAAARQNAESIHTLAEKLQQAIAGIEQAANEAKKEINTYRTLLFVSLALSAASMLLNVLLLAQRGIGG
ncbi:MAG TPA: hypothetical protein VNR18_12580 [Hyphomicrobiales bacterium]|nr:hypothetical protein [Hyphomicrobiales bacterium]